MKRKILKKMLCAAIMVSLVIPAIPASAAQGELPVTAVQAEPDDGTGEDAPEIVPYFNMEGHINRQLEYVAANISMTVQQKEIMKTAAQIADSEPYKNVRGFHARKNADGASNYLANLKALEICGVKIGNQSNLVSYVLGRMPNISAQDKNDVSQMVATVESYAERYATRAEKRYAVAGFGLHLIGDMFAHRTIIKKACLTNWGQPDTSTNVYFQDKDFIKSTLEQFKSEIRAGKLCTVDMKPYMKDQRWKNYIDNIRFMPNRIKAAERAAASFVQTVFTQGLGFPDINYYLTEYNLQLENFAQYKAVL